MSHGNNYELLIGAIIAHRFAIEQVAGEGGMGVVYKARDITDNRPVALKILHRQSATSAMPDPSRFFREAQLLAELRHPSIVSYVAHGQTAEGQFYLAMEWLSGIDLGKRLQAGPLTVAETLTLCRTVTEALAAAHRLGIVHRDLKPSNLFLRDGKVDQVTLFDFGIAQRGRSEPAVSRTGLVIGTPEYMAPEQARGERAALPATDVFALACIVYACLTGKPPFVGDHVAALLTKILFEEPPPLRSLCPDVPEALETLLAQMLAKDAHARPVDASALLPALDALAVQLAHSPEPGAPRSQPRRNLTAGEQRLYSVILAAPPVDEPSAGQSAEPAALPDEQALAALRGELANRQASLELLADGSLVAAVSPTASATDQVREAARLALLLWSRWPTFEFVIATGRGLASQQHGRPIGEALDRAAAQLRRRQQSSAHKEPGILLDAVSAGLLDPSFDVRDGNIGLLLWGASDEADEARLLLGKPSPCLGREQELGVLEALLAGCIDESQVQAVLLLAPPGVGKTRLRQEFLRRIQHRSVTILSGRGDPLLTAAPFGVIAQTLRRWAGLQTTASLSEQRDQLHARLAELSKPHAPALEVLAAACGLVTMEGQPWPPQTDTLRAFVTWIELLCSQRPLVILVDDLQWADEPSLRVLDTALRNLTERPLLVFGLGRPEVEKLFPKLWSGKAQDIRLGGLGKRACERLVLHALGKDVPATTIARIVTLSQGNALFLEELIRAVAEGKGDALPETVLAMTQARLLQLEPGARRVLRVASIFGQTFWRGGVLALLGQVPEMNAGAVDRWLKLLQETEVIEPHPVSRFPQDIEYSFRSAAMRDAAYSLLTDEDRQLGHGLAALYLEQAGEQDTAVLTGHTLKLVQYLEEKRSSLTVSRLMMLTGIPIRKILTSAPDDPKLLRRLRAGLTSLLHEDELKDLHHLFEER